MTDNEIIKALGICNSLHLRCGNGCPYYEVPYKNGKRCSEMMIDDALDLINRLKAENDKLFYKLQGVMWFVDKWLDGDELKQDEVIRATIMREKTLNITETLQVEIEGLQDAVKETISCFTRTESLYKIKCKELEVAKSEAIKEFAEKITEMFLRYAHLHNYADQARRAEVETVDGTKIELFSVWDVLTLKKHEMAEYEEMSELQHNIEYIANDRLLTELEKDFQLLVKEMTEQRKEDEGK